MHSWIFFQMIVVSYAIYFLFKKKENRSILLKYIVLITDIVQDMAAKGLSLIHINSSKEQKELLVSSILDQFTQGRKSVQQVTSDTKLFEEGQLGKSPTK